MQKEKLRP